MARFALGCGSKHGRNVIETFDVRLGREIQITPIRLRFSGEGVFQILFSLATFQIHGSLLPIAKVGINVMATNDVSPPA
jgi:hypothetical protein